MRATLAALLLLVASATAGTAGEVLADARVLASPIFSAGIFRTAVIPVRAATLRGLHTVDLSGPRLPAGTLRFARTWKVEHDTRQRLLDSLLDTTDDPEGRDAIEESVADGEAWREFDRTLGFAGYSSSNLADVTTAYYVIAWQVVTGEQAIDYLPGIRLVRDSVVLALLRDPAVAAMSDADKQAAAVVMAYKAIVAAHRARELRRSNDRTALVRLRQELRDSVAQAQGVDLAALRLTNLGFMAD